MRLQMLLQHLLELLRTLFFKTHLAEVFLLGLLRAIVGVLVKLGLTLQELLQQRVVVEIRLVNGGIRVTFSQLLLKKFVYLILFHFTLIQRVRLSPNRRR